MRRADIFSRASAGGFQSFTGGYNGVYRRRGLFVKDCMVIGYRYRRVCIKVSKLLQLLMLFLTPASMASSRFEGLPELLLLGSQGFGASALGPRAVSTSTLHGLRPQNRQILKGS